MSEEHSINFYEECLRLGQYLSQEEKVSLYQYLLTSKRNSYEIEARKLLRERVHTSFIANGEINYRFSKNVVSYTSREIDSLEFPSAIRELYLGKVQFRSVDKMCRFFAQAEVDVLSNFPLPGTDQNPDRSFSFNTIPYYDLNYYSNGKGKLRGLLVKLRKVDSEILIKLRTF